MRDTVANRHLATESGAAFKYDTDDTGHLAVPGRLQFGLVVGLVAGREVVMIVMGCCGIIIQSDLGK